MKKVRHNHGVIANQKVGVITNFLNNYSLLCELFSCSRRTYVNQHSATRDFDLFVFYHLTNRIRILRILKSNAHGKMTWHAAVSGNIKG
jgi:hypothetical protein